MTMKARYRILLLAIIGVGAYFAYYLFVSPLGEGQRMGNVIQAGAVFAALLAAAIAVAATDPKTLRVKIATDPSIALEEIGMHVKAELPPSLRAAFNHLNEKEEITIWIRMALGEANFTPFEVTVSINRQNAEGMTKKVEISHETPRS